MEIIAYLMAHTAELGLITLILSFLGFGMAVSLWAFIRKSDQPLARSLKHAYLSDAFLFLMTALFGLAGALHAPREYSILAYALRPAALAYCIWALFRLYRTFRKIGTGV